MPVYEFKCRECGAITGELRKISDYSPARCSCCKSSNTEKIFSLFAGSGKNCQSCVSSSCTGCSSCH